MHQAQSAIAAANQTARRCTILSPDGPTRTRALEEWCRWTDLVSSDALARSLAVRLHSTPQRDRVTIVKRTVFAKEVPAPPAAAAHRTSALECCPAGDLAQETGSEPIRSMGCHRHESQLHSLRHVLSRARVSSLPLTLTFCAVLSACSAPPMFPAAAPNTGQRQLPPERDFRPADLAKSDIDVAAEVHLRESLASARLVMEKLYRRNPREWHKGSYSSMEAALDHAFDPRAQFRFAELNNLRGTDAILLALTPEYSGDRVFAFGIGLASMILLAYNGKTEFYLTDVLDPQKLYNCSRNVEIAAWKLANA